jgi:hypothetical protein
VAKEQDLREARVELEAVKGRKETDLKILQAKFD